MAPYDSKEMNDALGFIKGLVDDGSIHPDTINISAPEARELFAQGQAAFLCQGTVSYTHLNFYRHVSSFEWNGNERSSIGGKCKDYWTKTDGQWH